MATSKAYFLTCLSHKLENETGMKQGLGVGPCQVFVNNNGQFNMQRFVILLLALVAVAAALRSPVVASRGKLT